MTTARSNIEVVAKAAVEAAPAYPSTIKQAVTTTAATDDGTINCGDGHRKKQSEVVAICSSGGCASTSQYNGASGDSSCRK